MQYSDVIATDKKHCSSNGKQCTKCCEAIVLPNTKVVREAYKTKHLKGSDLHWVGKHLTRISKRRAIKINPYLKTGPFGNNKADSSLYFTCKKLTPQGCGIYEDRPSTCKGYPYYNAFPEVSSIAPEYSQECTYWEKV